MQRLFIVLVLLVAVGVGLSYFLGWFHVTADSVGGNEHIGVTLDKDKFQHDKKAAQEKIHGLEHSAKDKAAADEAK